MISVNNLKVNDRFIVFLDSISLTESLNFPRDIRGTIYVNYLCNWHTYLPNNERVFRLVMKLIVRTKSLYKISGMV